MEILRKGGKMPTKPIEDLIPREMPAEIEKELERLK